MKYIELKVTKHKYMVVYKSKEANTSTIPDAYIFHVFEVEVGNNFNDYT